MKETSFVVCGLTDWDRICCYAFSFVLGMNPYKLELKAVEVVLYYLTF